MKIKNVLKKMIVTGAIVLGTIAPAYANESEVQAPVSNETAIEITVEEQEETQETQEVQEETQEVQEEVVVEEVVTEEVQDEVQDEVQKEVVTEDVKEETTIVEYKLEMTKDEWNEFVLENGWDNVQFVTTDGEYMVFEAFKCGVKTADIFLKELVHEPTPLPEVESEPLPEEPVLDGTENDNMTVVPEEEPPVLDGTENDNMTVVPEEEPPVLDGTENDNMTVVPEEPAEPVAPVVPAKPVVVPTEKVESTEKVVVKKQVAVKKPVVKKAVKKSGNGVIARDLMLNPKTGDTSMTINFVVIAISIIALFAVNRKKSVTMKK